MKLSLIVTTHTGDDGKPHPWLLNMLDSIREGGHDDVEVLIGVDGSRPLVIAAIEQWAHLHDVRTEIMQPWADAQAEVEALSEDDRRAFERRTVREASEGPCLKVFTLGHRGQWGNPQRNALMAVATGHLLHFNDHDDAYTPGALKTIVDAAQANPGRPLVFKMRVHSHGALTHALPEPDILWKTKGRVEESHIGGHMLVAPLRPEMLGSWDPEDIYAADFRYVSKTIENFAAAGIEAIWLDDVICELRPWSPKEGA